MDSGNYFPIDIDKYGIESFGIPRIGDNAHTSLLDVLEDSNSGPAKGSRSSLRRTSKKLGLSPVARNFISAFISEPPCLDDSSLTLVASSDSGFLSMQSEQQERIALAALTGDVYYSYWLVRGDGFHVTTGLANTFLSAVFTLPPEILELLENLGQVVHERRLEALVFKRNARKYVGNYNYRRLSDVTRRSDLLLMSAFGVDKPTIVNLIDYVRRTLAINVHAGEKAIPLEVKERYRPRPVSSQTQNTLRKVDLALIERFGFDEAELDYIINYDIKYRLGAEDGEDGE